MVGTILLTVRYFSPGFRKIAHSPCSSTCKSTIEVEEEYRGSWMESLTVSTDQTFDRDNLASSTDPFWKLWVTISSALLKKALPLKTAMSVPWKGYGRV